jgi:heavy metal sensor kinase
MALVLLGLGVFTYVRLSGDLVAAVDIGLRSRAQIVTDAVSRTQEKNVVAPTGRLIDPDEAFAQVFDGSGKLLDASSAVAGQPLLSPDEVKAVDTFVFMTRQIPGFDEPVRLLAAAVDKPARRVVVVGTNLGDTNDALGRLATVLLIVGPAGLILTSIAGWLLAGAALRPVERMRREAAAISASEPARRLRVPATGDELARLAGTLNSMLDRLQEALERERRFVDDASHELRTPLATLRAEIDLSLSRQRQASELETSLRSAQEDVGRLQRLADDLLVLARSRGGRIPVRRVPTALSELVAKAAASVDGEARAANVTIDVEAQDGTVEVDPDRIQQALRNLLENAIRHTPSGGHVRLTASQANGTIRLVVADTGPGFPPELIDAVFEPFIRGDGQASGPDGAGLGLTIVRAVAEAHGGTVSAENEATGARVTVELRT